jgi:SAM-dependent methyltransferase
MYHDLCKYLKRPELFEPTTEKFWNDPYIAAQILEAHLNPNHDSASRKPAFIIRSVEWIISLLASGASLLDIGCGPGLYTKRLAERGLNVTGIDLSEKSIEYASKHDANSRYFVRNYLEMDYFEEFDIVTLIYCDYCELFPEERLDLLRRVHKALKPGGLFLLDVYTPLKGRGKHDVTSWSLNPKGGFWSAKPHICLNATYYYGETAEGNRIVIIEEDNIRLYNFWESYFTRRLLLDEAAPIGFSEHGFYDDVTGQPYSDNAETLCAIFKRG